MAEKEVTVTVRSYGDGLKRQADYFADSARQWVEFETVEGLLIAEVRRGRLHIRGDHGRLAVRPVVSNVVEIVVTEESD